MYSVSIRSLDLDGMPHVFLKKDNDPGIVMLPKTARERADEEERFGDAEVAGRLREAAQLAFEGVYQDT
jgi:hypothetical protein